MGLVKKENSKLSYFVLFILIAQAGLPFFVGNEWLLIFFSLTALIFILTAKKWDFFILKFLIFFVALMTFQIILFGNFLIGTFLGILMRIVFAYLAIKIIGADFMSYYVKIIYVLTIIGLVLWLILSFVPGAYNLASSFSRNLVQPYELFGEHVRNNLIFYTNEYWLLDSPPRNAGAFWEPGGNGVFLLIAILFNTIKKQKLINKKNIVFFTAIITTFSLGTYTSVVIFLYAYLFLIKRVKFSTMLILVVLFGGFYVAFDSFDFLGDKFERRFENSKNLDKNTTYGNLNYRVGRNEQAILDMRAFAKSPIVGEGQFIKYEYGASASGITSFLKKWGILGFLFVFGSMLKSFKRHMKINNINQRYAHIAVITLVVVAFSQSLYGKPLFLGLSFMFLIFTNSEIYSKRN